METPQQNIPRSLRLPEANVFPQLLTEGEGWAGLGPATTELEAKSNTHMNGTRSPERLEPLQGEF